MQLNLNVSKPHFHVLDGLRGIAAIAVVIFHCYEILTPELTENPIAHGFLAVDFFFCLSGFVIAYAYDNRIGGIGAKQFFINRLIRLHPFIVLGTVLGLLGLFLDPFSVTHPVQEFGWGKIGIATICSLLMLPYPLLGRYENVFPLNAPAWSLSMEYFINIVYALVLVHISKKVLLVLLALSMALLIYTAYLHGNVLGGWGWGGGNYWDGYARVLFSFMTGLAVYRFQLVIQNKFRFWMYALLLLCLFLAPHFEKDWLLELLIVMLVFPSIIAAGAGTVVSGMVKRACVFLGNISYPLYMVHYWMIWILGNYAATNPSKFNLYIFSFIILLASIVMAWLALKLFDEPVRKWLAMKQNRRN